MNNPMIEETLDALQDKLGMSLWELVELVGKRENNRDWSEEELLDFVQTVMREKHVSGSHMVCLRKVGVIVNNKEVVFHLLMLGELHGNKGLCAKPARDMVLGVMFTILRNCSRTILLAEIFFFLLGLYDLPYLTMRVGEMMADPMYDPALLARCVRDNGENDPNCLYNGNGPIAMAMVRVLAVLLLYAALVAEVQGDEEKARWLWDIVVRIHGLDPRNDLGLWIAFQLTEVLATYGMNRVRELIAASTHLIEQNLDQFLSQVTHSAWKEAFTNHIVRPFLRKVQQARNGPPDEYTKVFVKVMDVVVMSRLIGIVSKSLVDKQATMPYMFVSFGGKSHMEVQDEFGEILYKHNVFSRYEKVGEDLVDPSGGSCPR